MKKLCECGCGEQVAARFVSGHNRSMTEAQRLGHYEIEQSGCWRWRGNISASGYGRFPERGTRKVKQAHAFFYERLVGPVPDGKILDHLCRNRACVNPNHLEPVTNTENVRRGDSAKLTKDDVAYIRSCGLPPRVLAERYPVSENTIRRIQGGNNWADVPVRRRPIVVKRGLSEASVLLIRWMAMTTTISQRAIAEHFGVTSHTVWMILHGRERRIDNGQA